MKILLTGASGFLGSALASFWQDAGHELALLLRPDSSLRRLGDRHFIVGRSTNDGAVQAFVEDFAPEAVVHTACSYGRQGETLLQLTDANLRFGMAILQALPANPHVPCVFLNTGSALPASTSNYALSKHQFSAWGAQLAKSTPASLRFVDIELQHMYGAGDDPSKFTTHVIRSCRRHEPTLRLTAGEQRRDFIYIEDVVSAYDTLLERAPGFGPASSIPVGSGEAPGVRQFVETAHRLCDSRTQLEFGAIPYRPSEAMHCQADLGQMRELGWAPRWTLEAGLAKTIELETS